MEQFLRTPSLLVCVTHDQEHFWRVPTYKRAMTFVFLVRYVLGYKSQMQWKKFTYEDLKLNVRCFKRWCIHEANLFDGSPKYLQLEEKGPITTPPAVKRKRLESSHSASDSPMKKVYVILSDSTDCDDE